MRTIRFGRHELGIMLWCMPTSIREWNFGYERSGTLFDTHAWWFGPLFVLVCDTRPLWEQLPSIGARSDETGAKRKGGCNV
jgi:hypothetical protein